MHYPRMQKPFFHLTVTVVSFAQILQQRKRCGIQCFNQSPSFFTVKNQECPYGLQKATRWSMPRSSINKNFNLFKPVFSFNSLESQRGIMHRKQRERIRKKSRSYLTTNPKQSFIQQEVRQLKNLKFKITCCLPLASQAQLPPEYSPEASK